MNQRSDARRNRERVLVAAEEVFREVGADAPLGLIATRAGVGRATLYRNFPDRFSLLAGVFARRFEKLEESTVGSDGDDRLERTIIEIVWYEHALPGLGELLRRSDPRDHSLLDPVIRKVRDLLTGALEHAHRTGAVRPDVTLADALAAIAMLDGLITRDVGDLPSEPLERGIEIVIRGLRSEDHMHRPIPRPHLE